MLVLLPILLTEYKITNSSFVLIPAKDMGESMAWFSEECCLVPTLASLEIFMFLISVTVVKMGQVICHRNRWPCDSLHLIATKLSFLLTVRVHHCLVVAFFRVVFTQEPWQMCWLLKRQLDDDTCNFCYISLAKASHSATPEFIKACGRWTAGSGSGIFSKYNTIKAFISDNGDARGYRLLNANHVPMASAGLVWGFFLFVFNS